MARFQNLSLSNRLRYLQRVVPVAIVVVAIVNQVGPARIIEDSLGPWKHYLFEIVFYGTTGPLVIWLTIRTVSIWVDQKEEAEAEVFRLNTELQQRVDERTRELREKNQALAQANEQLKELDRLKSEFVSLVSHELRAPLTNLRGALELMECDCSANNSHPCLYTLTILQDQASRLERLVEEVLTISRIEAGGLTLKRELVDLAAIANQVVEEFTMVHTNRLIQWRYSSQPLCLWADSDRLHQIISNLIDNALKYSPVDSNIVVQLEQQRHDGVLSITDSGPGIPPGEHIRVFEKFHRLDGRDSKEIYGYGLGLYFCQRLVTAMQGTIWVESDVNCGATFRIALPLAGEH